jgi:hypothetical protein
MIVYNAQSLEILLDLSTLHQGVKQIETMIIWSSRFGVDGHTWSWTMCEEDLERTTKTVSHQQII